MGHIRNECKVKKDGKQFAEVRSQRNNLLEDLHRLQDCFKKRKGGMHDAGIKEQEITTVVDELRDELWKKDKRMSELAGELEMLHVSVK